MNGQKIFERLNAMTEEERKACQFWWITNKQLIINFLDGLRNDYKEINENVWEKIENELFKDNNIVLMQDDVEEELHEEDAFNGIFDDYSGLLHYKLEEYIRTKAKENGIEIKWNF